MEIVVSSAKAFVLSVYPEAECSGPVDLYWPVVGTRKDQYIVVSSPYNSRPEGEGGSPEEAWEDAARRISLFLWREEGFRLGLERAVEIVEQNRDETFGCTQRIADRIRKEIPLKFQRYGK
jgi:hypothetical protein